MINIIKPLYRKAHRTILYGQDKITGNFYHLFSVTELIPPDSYDYDLDKTGWMKSAQRSTTNMKKSGFTFYLRMEDLDSVDHAIDDFNSPIQLKAGEHTLQFFNEKFTREPTGDFPLLLSSNLLDPKGVGAILPKRNSGCFVWSNIDHERVAQKFFEKADGSREIQAMSQLTNDWLGFDIWNKSEHIGNTYLSAPNPYFRDLAISLSRIPTGIFYDFKMRENIEENMSVRIVDRHGDHIALDQQFKLSGYKGIIELPHEPHEVSVSVYNEKGNLIAVKPPAVFLKSINIDMSAKQVDLQVNLDYDTGKTEHIIIQKYASNSPLKIGETSEFNPAYYFKEAEQDRKHIDHEASKEFVFFPGGKSPEEIDTLRSKAKEIIQEIINIAHENCYLIDPYFSLLDLIYFGFHVQNSSVKLTILASKEYIDKKKALAINAAIAEYNAKPFQKIEFRLLRGESILHDRFIVADTNVWYLGSSFNQFGKRATCIAKVPRSSDRLIIKQIERWILKEEYSESLEKYIENA